MHANQKVIERCRKAGLSKDVLDELQKLDREIDEIMTSGNPTKSKGPQEEFQKLAEKYDPWERS